MSQLKDRGFEREFKFKASKSRGKGGQHVNKVMTKVELTFNLPKSKVLTEDERFLAKERLKNKLSLAGNIRIAVETSRSQLKNKNLSIERFYNLMEKALKKPKYRKPTEPTKVSIEKRYTEKHIMSDKKKSRKNIDLRSIEND